MTTTTEDTTDFLARMGNGSAIHLANKFGILCNRWGSTNGTVKAPKRVVDATEATCRRCVKIAGA